MQETSENCSWQEICRLNGVVLNGEEDFDPLELDEIDTIIVGITHHPDKIICECEH